MAQKIVDRAVRHRATTGVAIRHIYPLERIRDRGFHRRSVVRAKGTGPDSAQDAVEGRFADHERPPQQARAPGALARAHQASVDAYGDVSRDAPKPVSRDAYRDVSCGR